MAAQTNIVGACYFRATGLTAPGPDGSENASRAYLNWCEAKVNKWSAACKEFGYDQPTFEIRTLTGSVTYHEWLKKEVRL